MVREIKDTSPQTQQPTPAPLGRAPVCFSFIVVVVELLWRRALAVLVDVARRPAHFLWCVERSLSAALLTCAAWLLQAMRCVPSKPAARLIWQLRKPERPLTAAFAGRTTKCFCIQADAKGLRPTKPFYGSRAVLEVGEALGTRLPMSATPFFASVP